MVALGCEKAYEEGSLSEGATPDLGSRRTRTSTVTNTHIHTRTADKQRRRSTWRQPVSMHASDSPAVARKYAPYTRAHIHVTQARMKPLAVSALADTEWAYLRAYFFFFLLCFSLRRFSRGVSVHSPEDLLRILELPMRWLQ